MVEPQNFACTPKKPLPLQGNTALHVANKKSSRLVAWKMEMKCKEKKVELGSVKNKVSI